MKHSILILILLLALSFRFFDLGIIPVGFHRDEANLGYNAFTLLKTGKDVTGNVLPLHIESFLYSPAGYSYFSVPFVAFFGLNEFSVRFVSALFGTLTVLVAYFLVRELFGGRKNIALLSSFFLAISPWHINLSRVATENILVVFFISVGVLCYLHWVKTKKRWLLLLSFLCFGGTLLLYQAPRAFLPLFLPLLFFFFYPKPLKKNILLPAFLFLLVIIVPIFLVLSSHDLSQRIRMLSIFQHPQTQLVLNEQIREDGSAGSVLVTRVFHNKLINYSSTFLQNYFSHFSYNFLFTDSGLPDRYRIPQMGLLYIFELPLLLFGIWKLLAIERRKALFLGGWILLAPFGSAFTFDDVPNLQRTLIIFPALVIVIAYGFLHLWQCLGKLPFAKIGKGLAIFSIVYSVAFYLHQYYVHQKNHRPWYRQEGYKELVAQVNGLKSDYQKIIITDEESDPAIFFLFYNKYDPALLTYNEQKSFSSYQFVDKTCPLHDAEEIDLVAKQQLVPGVRKTLYVNHGNCKVEDARVKTLSEIKRTDGTGVFRLQEVQN